MMTTRTRIGALTACFFMALCTTLVAGAQTQAPCEQDARHRALDFWLGEWQVVDSDGQLVGTNRIEKSQNGCLIEESWRSSSGATGQSMNYFDPADGLWRQHWVDQGGRVVQYEGGVEDGVLRYRGRHIRRDGTVAMARVVLEPIGEGRLRHRTEHSSDDGGSWSTYFEATYVPVGEQAAVAAAPREEPVAVAEEVTAPTQPMPRPEVETAAVEDQARTAVEPTPKAMPVAAPPAGEGPQPQATRQATQQGSEVKAVTRELQREEIPEEQTPELVMASPMVLEVTPGNVEDYPEDTAWRTEETAGFICDEVTIRQVGVGHKSRRDKVNLIVSSLLFTHRRLKKVDLRVELINSGTVVASEAFDKIRLGLNIPAHGEDGLVAIAELELTAEQFSELFSSDSDPLLRFTLTCPSGG